MFGINFSGINNSKTSATTNGDSDSLQTPLLKASIFTDMDKDGNGFISAAEAKAYGFSAWEIKDDLKKSDFEAKVKTYNEKLLAESSEKSESDLSHHFTQAGKNGKVIQDITLSSDEQQTLLKRMNDFEQYKAGLSEEELTALEKNKNSILDFAFKYWDRGEEYKSYDEFEQYSKELKAKLEENIKAGKTTTLTNEELAQVLYATDTTDMISDGKLGSSAQGMSGDCWALSQFNNYAQSKEGAENIANRIKQNDDGTFTVTFQNPTKMDETKSYTVSKDELKNFGVKAGIMDTIIGRAGKIPLVGNKVADTLYNAKEYFTSDENKSGAYSAGDIDTRVYEIATSKMLEEFGQDGDKTINGGSPIKRVLLHRAMGYKSDIVTYQRYLEEDTKLAKEQNKETNNNQAEDFAPELFKSAIEQTPNAVFAITYGLDKKGQLSTKVAVEEGCENLSDVLKNHPELKAENLTCNTQQHKDTGETSKDNRYIQGGHVYNMRSIDKENGTIILQDPYNSAFPITISQDRFANRDENDQTAHDFVRMTYLPLE